MYVSMPKWTLYILRNVEKIVKTENIDNIMYPFTTDWLLIMPIMDRGDKQNFDLEGSTNNYETSNKW